MRIVVKKDEIYAIEKDMLAKIDDIISELQIIDKIKDKLIWEGKSHSNFIKKYNEILEKETKYIRKLEELVKFLDDVLLNYGYALDEIKGQYNGVRGR